LKSKIVSPTQKRLDERDAVYKLARESAEAHFKDRRYTQDEFIAYQETYIRTYFQEPKRPLPRWNDYNK
jgi:hypothetical protein